MKTIGKCSATCNVTWDAMNGHRNEVKTNWSKGSGRSFLIRPLGENLDINVAYGDVRRVAHGSTEKGHTDDLYHERMVAFSVSPSFSSAVVVWQISFLQV